MSSHRNLVFAVLAVVVLGGCAKRIELRVKSDPAGNPVIDPTFHDSAVVKPGDRIVWTCRCPPGTEFTVEDLRFAGDLDEIVELFLPHIEDPRKLETGIRAMESVQRRTESSGEIDEPAPLQEAIALLAGLKSAFSPDEQRPLFKRSWSVSPGEGQGGVFKQGPEFVDGNKRLRGPGRVAKGIGNGLWVFTWRVRLKGDQATERDSDAVEWDPHIIGHEEIKY